MLLWLLTSCVSAGGVGCSTIVLISSLFGSEFSLSLADKLLVLTGA